MRRCHVVRCRAERRVDLFLQSVIEKRPRPPMSFASETAYIVRCENPLGHEETEHRGTKYDEGRHVFTWHGAAA